MEVSIFSTAIFSLAILTWSVGLATILSVLIVGVVGDNVERKAETIGLAVVWPILILPALVVSLYRVPVKTAKTIRQDLHNKGLLREFEAFLKERKKENV